MTAVVYQATTNGLSATSSSALLPADADEDCPESSTLFSPFAYRHFDPFSVQFWNQRQFDTKIRTTERLKLQLFVANCYDFFDRLDDLRKLVIFYPRLE